MTAERILKKHLQKYIHEQDYKGVPYLNAMEEYSRLKCEEQKAAVATDIEKLDHYTSINRNFIMNVKNPCKL